MMRRGKSDLEQQKYEKRLERDELKSLLDTVKERDRRKRDAAFEIMQHVEQANEKLAGLREEYRQECDPRKLERLAQCLSRELECQEAALSMDGSPLMETRKQHEELSNQLKVSSMKKQEIEERLLEARETHRQLEVQVEKYKGEKDGFQISLDTLAGVLETKLQELSPKKPRSDGEGQPRPDWARDMIPLPRLDDVSTVALSPVRARRTRQPLLTTAEDSPISTSSFEEFPSSHDGVGCSEDYPDGDWIVESLEAQQGPLGVSADENAHREALHARNSDHRGSRRPPQSNAINSNATNAEPSYGRVSDSSQECGGRSSIDSEWSSGSTGPSSPCEVDRSENETKLQWVELEEIGVGSFGRVCTVFDTVHGKTYAMKRIKATRIDSGEQDTDQVCKEIAIMKNFNHPNIVKYLGAERTDDELHIFLEYMSRGSIAALLKSIGRLEERMIRVYLTQILAGVEYLHGNSVVHGDIKCANLLLDAAGNVKVSDFGCSFKADETKSFSNKQRGDVANVPDALDGYMLLGSCPWMAPECINDKTPRDHCKSDIWSVGISVIEMATGTHPWPKHFNFLRLMFHIAKLYQECDVPSLPARFPAHAHNFVSRCLDLDEKRRWSAAELSRHQYLITSTSHQMI